MYSDRVGVALSNGLGFINLVFIVFEIIDFNFETYFSQKFCKYTNVNCIYPGRVEHALHDKVGFI